MKKEQENHIIQEAYKLFWEKGYTDTTMQDIINASKISKGGIYYYFKSKEEILDKAIDSQLQELFLCIKNIFEDDKLNPLEKIKKCIDSKTNFFLEKYDLIKNIYSQDKHMTIRHFISKKMKQNIHPYVLKNFEEGKKLGLFNFEYSEQATNIFLSAHDFVFNYDPDIIKNKKDFELQLLAIKSIANKVFNS